MVRIGFPAILAEYDSKIFFEVVAMGRSIQFKTPASVAKLERPVAKESADVTPLTPPYSNAPAPAESPPNAMEVVGTLPGLSITKIGDDEPLFCHVEVAMVKAYA